MALSDQERERIIEEERVRWETRRLLLEQSHDHRACRTGRRHRAGRFFFGALLIGGIAFLATACGRHHMGFACDRDPAKRAQACTEHLSKKLDLSKEQQAQALPLVQALVDERESWRGEGVKVLAGLKAQFAAASFDAKALEKDALAREAKLAQSRKLVLEKIAAFHAILTPEQRSKAAELLGKLEARWAKHHKG